MDTVDKTDEVKKPGPGRPKKVDPSTPQGEQIARQADEYKKQKIKDKVVETWYEVRKGKLSLCKKKATGTRRVFIGSIEDKKTGDQVKEFIRRLEKDNKVRHVV